MHVFVKRNNLWDSALRSWRNTIHASLLPVIPSLFETFHSVEITLPRICGRYGAHCATSAVLRTDDTTIRVTRLASRNSFISSCLRDRARSRSRAITRSAAISRITSSVAVSPLGWVVIIVVEVAEATCICELSDVSDVMREFTFPVGPRLPNRS